MENILKTRRCDRCGGNLFLEYDQYGFYVVCIQCGADYPSERPHYIMSAMPRPARREPVPVATR